VKRAKKVVVVTVTGEQASRLMELARRWGVTEGEALRRVLDQAFIGRGALVALKAGFIAMDHFASKPEEKKPAEKP
jgi:hypothetical protein